MLLVGQATTGSKYGGLTHYNDNSTPAASTVLYNADTGGLYIDNRAVSSTVIRTSAIAGTPVAALIVTKDGYVGVKQAPSYPLDVDGQIRAHGTVTMHATANFEGFRVYSDIPGWGADGTFGYNAGQGVYLSSAIGYLDLSGASGVRMGSLLDARYGLNAASISGGIASSTYVSATTTVTGSNLTTKALSFSASNSSLPTCNEAAAGTITRYSKTTTITDCVCTMTARGDAGFTGGWYAVGGAGDCT